MIVNTRPAHEIIEGIIRQYAHGIVSSVSTRKAHPTFMTKTEIRSDRSRLSGMIVSFHAVAEGRSLSEETVAAVAKADEALKNL